MICVRFAPSPTGYLHIGGARTALFNWLYARAQNGRFILRIEDTDQERSKAVYVDEILNSMQWLGLAADEIYRQSERFELYRKTAESLLEKGLAYREGLAVLLKIEPQEIKLFDLIRGEIVFDAGLLKDEVLIKSDGSPTYSFACVVDDLKMEITHVIRGEDHISNTPKQMMIYQALGHKPPKYAHLPLIMASDGTRLSKRTGAVAVMDYQKQGFLPEALVNYLLLLGWSPGENQELISLDSAVKKFSIKKVNKSAAAFSMEKLKWINAQYIKQKDPDALTDILMQFMRDRNLIPEDYDRQRMHRIVELYKNRMTTLEEFVERTRYLFDDRAPIDEDLKNKYLSADRSKEFTEIYKRFGQLHDFNRDSAEQAFREAVADQGCSMADLVHPVRVALTGSDVGPGLFETMELLGRKQTVDRLKQAFQHQ